MWPLLRPRPPHLGASLALPLPSHTLFWSIASKTHSSLTKTLQTTLRETTASRVTVPIDGEGLGLRPGKGCLCSEPPPGLKSRSLAPSPSEELLYLQAHVFASPLVSLAAPVPTSTPQPHRNLSLRHCSCQVLLPSLVRPFSPCYVHVLPHISGNGNWEPQTGPSSKGQTGPWPLGGVRAKGAGLGVEAAPPPTGPSWRPRPQDAHLPCRLSLSPHTLPAGGSPALLAQGQTPLLGPIVASSSLLVNQPLCNNVTVMSGGGVPPAGIPPAAAHGAASQSHWAPASPTKGPEGDLSSLQICSKPIHGLHHAQDADPTSEGLALLTTHSTLLLHLGTQFAK